MLFDEGNFGLEVVEIEINHTTTSSVELKGAVGIFPISLSTTIETFWERVPVLAKNNIFVVFVMFCR